MERYSSSTARPTLNTPERREDGSTHQPAPATPRHLQDEGLAKYGKKPTKQLLIGVLGLVILLALAWWLTLGRNSGLPSYIDTSKYQAVFLQSGESYFGKISSVGADTIQLTNVFYVQKSTQADTSKTASGNKLELIKLGNEIHGPEDRITFSRSQVQYVENLKDDGQVVQKILEFNQPNKK